MASLSGSLSGSVRPLEVRWISHQAWSGSWHFPNIYQISGLLKGEEDLLTKWFFSFTDSEGCSNNIVGCHCGCQPLLAGLKAYSQSAKICGSGAASQVASRLVVHPASQSASQPASHTRWQHLLSVPKAQPACQQRTKRNSAASWSKQAQTEIERKRRKSKHLKGGG